MTPLGWGWALFVWGYALAWFLVNDRVKLLAYRIIDRGKAKAKPEAKSAPEPEAKDGAKPGNKPKPRPEPQRNRSPKPVPSQMPKLNLSPKTKLRLCLGTKQKPSLGPDRAEIRSRTEGRNQSQDTANLTPLIAKRAYEIYEQRSHKGDLAAQDWEQAKRDIGKNETKAEPNPEAAAEPKP